MRKGDTLPQSPGAATAWSGLGEGIDGQNRAVRFHHTGAGHGFHCGVGARGGGAARWGPGGAGGAAAGARTSGAGGGGRAGGGGAGGGAGAADLSRVWAGDALCWAAVPRFLGGSRAEVVEIVDIIHVSQYLWAVGAGVFGPETPAAAAWVTARLAELRSAGAPPVLAALAALESAAALAGEAIRVATGYLTTHQARLDYPRFLARGLPIGSGAVESTCKLLISQRAKQAGMRWSAAGLQAVASLRARHRSGTWAAFWQGQPQRQERLLGRPRRPRPTSPVAPLARLIHGPPPPDDPRLAALPAERHAPPPPLAPPVARPAPRRPGPPSWRHYQRRSTPSLPTLTPSQS